MKGQCSCHSKSCYVQLMATGQAVGAKTYFHIPNSRWVSMLGSIIRFFRQKYTTLGAVTTIWIQIFISYWQLLEHYICSILQLTIIFEVENPPNNTLRRKFSYCLSIHDRLSKCIYMLLSTRFAITRAWMNDCNTSEAVESLCIITLMIPFLSSSKYLAKKTRRKTIIKLSQNFW